MYEIVLMALKMRRQRLYPSATDSQLETAARRITAGIGWATDPSIVQEYFDLIEHRMKKFEDGMAHV